MRVLIVDGHPMMRAGVAALLNAEADLEVVGEADDGPRAVQLAAELGPDLVVTEASLPKLGGPELVHRLVAREPRVRVLVLSANEELACARSALAAGAGGCVLKRSACDELLQAVRVVGRGGTYVDPALRESLARSRSVSASSGAATEALSEREAEVVRLTARGHSSKEVAEALGISPRTVETYKARAMSKLGLHTRADLINYALRSGWLSDVPPLG